MVLRRIGFSRVEREPLGAMVGNYSVRRTGNKGINWSEKRRNALKRPCAGLTMVDWRRRRIFDKQNPKFRLRGGG